MGKSFSQGFWIKLVYNFSYQLPKVFLQRYVFDLSSEAFCILVRTYKFYLENKVTEGTEISVPFKVFRKEILGTKDKDIIETVLGELDYWKLLKRDYKNSIYEFNLKQIDRENKECLRIKNGELTKESFKIKITDKKIEEKSISPELTSYVDKITGRYSSILGNKLKKLIIGNIQFFLRKKDKIEIREIHFLVRNLINEEDFIVERVCDAYNNNKGKYGQVHPNYIQGILKNVKEQGRSKNSLTKKILEKHKKEKEEDDRKFGLKIATGKIQESVAYKSHIELKDFKNLKILYRIGISVLKEQNREKEIFKDYEWLKYD